MTQSFTQGLVFGGSVTIGDGANLDPFSRLRVSNPVGQLDAQFTYDLQPLIFEARTTGTGATIVHDATNRMALMTLAASPSGSYTYLQTYEWFRYQAGRGQLPIITFNMNSGAADVIKFAEYGDGNNAYGFMMSGTTPVFYIQSLTNNGNQLIAQSAWNIDPLNGAGASGKTFDSSKEQILIIDFQALYVGRVRMGFDIGGQIVYCHEFLHSNNTTYPYVQNASLPIRCGMRSTATVSTTMWMNCATVLSEGVQDDVGGYHFVQEGSTTAANGVDTHVISIRPKPTFNGIANRTKFVLESVDIFGGLNPVSWKLVLGQGMTGTMSFLDVNSAYSGMQYNTTGTISGLPSIIVDQGYVASSASARGSQASQVSNRYPITLDAGGNNRSLGTISIIAQGIGGTSAMRAIIGWKEIR